MSISQQQQGREPKGVKGGRLEQYKREQYIRGKHRSRRGWREGHEQYIWWRAYELEGQGGRGWSSTYDESVGVEREKTEGASAVCTTKRYGGEVKARGGAVQARMRT